MKKIVVVAVCLLIFISSCKKTIPEVEVETITNKVIPSAEIDAFIKQKMSVYHSFEWNMASGQMIWSALQQSDHILSIGYKPSKEVAIENKMADIDINSNEWASARETLLQMILQSEQKLNNTLTLESIIPWKEGVLPVVDVIVRNPSTLQILLSSSLVRYAEPMGYEPGVFAINKQPDFDQAVASSSGCGSNTAHIGLVLNQDYYAILPAAKESWNYTYHNISKAWSKSTGAGTKVFIIDTGCEFDQENLGTAFNQGNSSGRTIEKIVTLPRSTFLGINTGPVETPDDGCGHGTSMAGACAAPRGTDGNMCGVAYNCNLVTCRAAEDVYLDESRESKAVADAFTNAGNRNDVKIISMSMGRITSSAQIKDAILFANGKGKLIFCAAGTSFSWTSGWVGVIFPASMTEVNVVTGVKDNSFSKACDNCHDGSEIDFTIVMEKSSNGIFPLSLAMIGDVPSTVGGSSVSTATAAGIAALVWSRFPAYTRDQVLNKLIQTSANYPIKNNNKGWGNLNADAATN